MKLGTFVCDKNDKEHSCLAIVVYDHSETGCNDLSSIKWLEDGKLSLRDDSDLKMLTPLEFCKSWCKKQMGYADIQEINDYIWDKLCNECEGSGRM